MRSTNSCSSRAQLNKFFKELHVIQANMDESKRNFLHRCEARPYPQWLITASPGTFCFSGILEHAERQSRGIDFLPSEELYRDAVDQLVIVSHSPRLETYFMNTSTLFHRALQSDAMQIMSCCYPSKSSW